MLGTLHVELRDDLDLESETSCSVPSATTNPCGRRLRTRMVLRTHYCSQAKYTRTLLSSSAACKNMTRSCFCCSPFDRNHDWRFAPSSWAHCTFRCRSSAKVLRERRDGAERAPGTSCLKTSELRQAARMTCDSLNTLSID
jgi:hypothetical protein